MAAPTPDMAERFKRWHWGEEPIGTVEIKDKRFPDEMIGIGRFMEMRLRDSPKGTKGVKVEKFALVVDEDEINQNYLVFDHNHPKERMYFLLSNKAKGDMKRLWKESKEEPLPLTHLAAEVGGIQSMQTNPEGIPNDYPDVMVKPLGYVSHLVYFTNKKGDGPSGYIHEMGEEGGIFPMAAVDKGGDLWLAGGSYTCPYAGITN